jgi:hypothetical protein
MLYAKKSKNYYRNFQTDITKPLQRFHILDCYAK